MPRIPTRDEYRTRWAGLDRDERRAIVRAVNRGQQLEDRSHAALAVRLARNQKGFWSKAWLLGPLAALLVLSEGIGPYLANAALSSVVLGFMSVLWFKRAERAERQNLAVATGRPEDEVTVEKVRPFRDLLARLPLPWSLRSRLARGGGSDEPVGDDDPTADPQVPGVDYPTEPVRGRGHTPRSKRKR
jgi:hypothetical protein